MLLNISPVNENKYMKLFKYSKLFKFFTVIFIAIFFLNSCGLYQKTDQRNRPAQAKDRAKQNIKEGRGVSLKSIIGRKGGNGTFEFSSSNPMWRASLEILDFLPLATVDYSGGIIITDWYTDSQKANDSIKITVRFLSTEILSNSVKVIVHTKVCDNNLNCRVKETNSKIKEELTSSILKKAAQIESDQRAKKKKK